MGVDVLITAYNATKTISETIYSVIKQDYEEWIIVLVDDGSTDNLLDLIRSDFADLIIQKRLNYYRIERLGRARALNFGVSQCKSDYVAILDADDLWEESKLRRQCDLMESCTIEFSLTNFKPFNSKLSRLIVEDLYAFEILQRFDLIRSIHRVTHSSLLVRRELLSYNESLERQLDLDLYISFMKAGYSCAYFEDPLVNKRVHENQFFESDGNLSYRINALKMLYPIYLRNGFVAQLLMDLLKLFFALLPSRVRNIIKIHVKDVL